MKKAIPVLIAVVLILVTAGGWAGVKLYERFSYSKERADLGEYFEQASQPEEAAGEQAQPLAENEAFLLLQNEVLKERARIQDGKCYLTLEQVHRLLNDRFYEDAEGLLLYSWPDDIMVTEIGSTVMTSGYYKDGVKEEDKGYVLSFYDADTLYVALDYVREYTGFDYAWHQETPQRIQLVTEWQEQSLADVKKNTSVRYQGGIKSPILTDVSKGETLVVLETMENWSKVKTQTGIMGYVENKRLENLRSEAPIKQSDYLEPEYTSISREHQISLGWHQVTNRDANGTLESYAAKAGAMNVISPTWYSISDETGNVTNIASREYVEKAHAMGLEVWALVDDFKEGLDLNALLSARTSRYTLIENLMEQAAIIGFDGINIDFENIDAATGQGFSQFLRELSIRCRQDGIVLSVDNYVPRDHSAHYNRREQGLVADYVIIMGYDEHWGGGGVAGSVASIGFVEDGIQRTLQDVPADKLINAVPFYTRIWITENGAVTSQAVGMDNADAFLAQRNAETVWDEETCQDYAELEDGGIRYQVWLENERSLEVKLNVMKANNLAGVAAWKLGFERPGAWDVIAAYLAG